MKRSSIFCDWLDVTCHPDDSFLVPLRLFLMMNSFEPFVGGEGREVYRVGEGTIHFDFKMSFHRSSVSGSSIRALEAVGLWRDYLNVLGSVAHTVTRNDLALDLYVDSPAFLRGLEAKYPTDDFSFTRKSLRVLRVYSTRASDGALTGTWYAGHRTKSSITCRVYDKQNEMLERHGSLIEPTTRVELTFRKGIRTSLFDVIQPDDLFYHTASPELVSKPEHAVYPWVSKGTNCWVSSTGSRDLLTIQNYTLAVERSEALIKLAGLGADCGAAAKPIVMRRFEEILDSIIKEGANQSTNSD